MLRPALHPVPSAVLVRATERLRRPIDFERVLRTRSHAQTVHFAVHYLPGRPAPRVKPQSAAAAPNLSTADAPMPDAPGDNFASTADAAASSVPSERAVDGLWLGMVVPKRHAKRSVTRSLMKRQIRASVAVSRERLPSGLWVVRLRAPFDKSVYPSAASAALQAAVRTELEQLFKRVTQRTAAAA